MNQLLQNGCFSCATRPWLRHQKDVAMALEQAVLSAAHASEAQGGWFTARCAKPSLKLTAEAPENRPKLKRKGSFPNHLFSGANSQFPGV